MQLVSLSHTLCVGFVACCAASQARVYAVCTVSVLGLGVCHAQQTKQPRISAAAVARISNGHKESP